MFPRPEIDIVDLVASLTGINDWLRCWKDWSLDFPPSGRRFGPMVDALLADEFRILIMLRYDSARLEYLEGVIFDFREVRGRGERAFRDMLIGWWMEIHKGWAPTIGRDTDIDTFIERYCRVHGHRFNAQVLETLAVPFQVGNAWTAEAAAEVIEELIDIYGLRS